MVDVLGHLGMALLWLAPGWYFIDRPKTALTFVATSFWFGMVPDVDLVLSNYLQIIHHHGVFHTIAVVTLLAAILGPVFGLALRKLFGGSEWFSSWAADNAIAIGIIGVWIPGLSHLFADMLSAPDIASPIEPLWPLYNGSIVLIDVLWYASFWATWGLFTAGIAVNAVMWYWKAAQVESSVKAMGSRE